MLCRLFIGTDEVKYNCFQGSEVFLTSKAEMLLKGPVLRKPKKRFVCGIICVLYDGTAWRYAGLLFERRRQYAWTRRTRRRHGRPGNGRRNAWRRPYGRPAAPTEKKRLRRLLRRPDVHSDFINNRAYRARIMPDILDITENISQTKLLSDCLTEGRL